LRVSKEESSSIPVILVTISKYQPELDHLVSSLKSDLVHLISQLAYLLQSKPSDTTNFGIIENSK
jgi:hypothetical protein